MARALKGLDASFLYLESDEVPMHVGALHLIERPKGKRQPYVDLVRAHVAKRLHLSQVLEQQLKFLPLDMGHPVWERAPELDLTRHIVALKLPEGSDQAALNRLVAKLHGQLLPRDRPLWMFYVIEGLASGEIGFYTKIHHAALDGQAGVVLANALLDLTAVPREVPPRGTYKAKPILKSRSLIGAAFRSTVQQYWKVIKLVPDVARAVSSMASAEGASAWLKKLKSAPKTPFNAQITAARSFATASVSLSQTKALARQLGVTLNDLVLFMVATALRDFLKRRRALPTDPLVAAVPVSLREKGNTEINNQATMVLANLATDLADPGERLAAIVASMNQVKAATGQLKNMIPTDYPSLGAPWLVGGLNSLLGRTKLADYVRLPANVIVSNVPGPPVTLYLAGGRLKSYFPVSIPIHGLALNITVQSYGDRLDFGLIAAKVAVPSPEKIAAAIETALDQLK
jgi:diacylglycerol O-acyltransferase / wax synthase